MSSLISKSVADWLGSYTSPPQHPSVYVPAIRAYLLADTGGDLRAVSHLPQLEVLVQAIATLYARMVVGDGLIPILRELQQNGQFNTVGKLSSCEELIV
jgi:hypothetical protein